jgi:hypothetical protein
LCGTIATADSGQWLEVECRLNSIGDTVRISHQTTYLQFCEIRINGYATDIPEEWDSITPIGGAQLDVAATYGFEKLYDRFDDTNPAHEVCYISATAAAPWVELYLDGRYKVAEVNLRNRGDCCGEQAIGIEIFVCDGDDCSLCGTVQYGNIGSWLLTECESNLYGDAIRLQQRNKLLSICEVEIKGRGSPFQTPVTNKISPVAGAQKDRLAQDVGFSKMYDGILNTDYSAKSCYHSASAGPDTWVEVYLNATYVITDVALLNRGDAAPQRALYEQVFVCNGAGGEDCELCGTVDSDAAAQWLNTRCRLNLAGDTIRIRHKTNYLQICEISITGYLSEYGQAEETEVLTPVGGSQLDALATYGVSKLYDGSNEEESFIGLDRCYHSASIVNPWVELYLDGRYKITDVNVLNRGDAAPERWNGVKIFVCDDGECELCGMGEFGSIGSWQMTRCDYAMYGDTIRITHTNQYLQMCEVQIKGIGAPKLPEYLRSGQKVIPVGGAQKDQLGLWDYTKIYDGGVNTNINGNECYHSGSATPWVELFFDDYYTITKVSLLNRGDAAPARARYTRVLVCDGPSTAQHRSDCKQCGINEAIGAGEWLPITCQLNAFGDRLRIELPAEYLQICEIDIEGFPGTFQTEKLRVVEATASSEDISGQYPVSNVIDGEPGTNQDSLSCFASDEPSADWLKLKFAPAIVNTIRLLSRADCCWEELLGAEVSVCESEDVCTRCGIVDYTSAGQWVDVPCDVDTTLHTYVQIKASSDSATQHYLYICEAEILGVNLNQLPELPTKLEITGGESSSLYGPEYSYENLYDGNLSTLMFENSCFHSGSPTSDWVELNVSPAMIDTVKLLNRQDCCEERLNEAIVFVCEATNSCRLCEEPVEITPGQPWLTVMCKIPGNRIKIQAASQGDHYINLCEVEIYGTTL